MEESKNKSVNDFSQSSVDEQAAFHEYNRRKREGLQTQPSHYEKEKMSSIQSLSQNTEFNYEISAIFVENDINSPPVLAGNWTAFSMSEQRQNIANKIIQSTYRYSLKALGFQVSLKIDLGEQSELWIMSREENKNCIEHSAVKIGREIFTDRLFVKLGSHIGPNGEFRFFKTYEIPSSSSTLNIEYSDSGNDTITVEVKTEKRRKQVCKSSNFMPVFHPCNLMIAGIGSQVFINSIAVSQFKRKISGFEESRCNCSVF